MPAGLHRYRKCTFGNQTSRSPACCSTAFDRLAKNVGGVEILPAKWQDEMIEPDCMQRRRQIWWRRLRQIDRADLRPDGSRSEPS